MRRIWLAAGLLLLAARAVAGAFDDALEQGYAKLRAGDLDAAMTVFRDLQTDEPESDLVYYSVASAQYARGLAEIEAESPEDALAQFQEARSAFRALAASRDRFIRDNASYNAANCTAQSAKLSVGLGDHEASVKAFEDSIAAYVEILRTNPDHAGAQKNLSHMRYTMKQMLQNPPPQQQQVQSKDGDEDGENQEKKEPEKQEEKGEDSEQEKGADQDANKNGPKPQDQEMEPSSRQNIDAILKSLEDLDREEQKNLRRAKGPARVRGRKWW